MGAAHSGLSPEPISVQPAAPSGVGNILITGGDSLGAGWTVDTLY